MIHASLAIFACLCVGILCYRVGRRWGYEHGYRKGCLDEYRDSIKDRLAGKKEAYSLGRAWGIKLATDMLSLNAGGPMNHAGESPAQSQPSARDAVRALS